MTREAALLELAERALPTCETPDEKLSVYQAVAAAFEGVCAERSQAAHKTVQALLAAEKAQLEFKELLRMPPRREGGAAR